jgi:cysteine desulfurase
MIYLDNNATTAPLPQVVRAVAEAMEWFYANPSSGHQPGGEARRALESARERIAGYFCATGAFDNIFTASGTESINLAFSLLAGPLVSQIVIPATEHSAVSLAAHRWAGNRGVRVVGVSTEGEIDLAQLDGFLAGNSPSSSFVSIAAANNETGVLTDVPTVAKLCRRHKALLHVDAVQAAGKIPISLDRWDCDAISIAAHKFHGPRGCGVLFTRPTAVRNSGGRPLQCGHQERGFRGGTENVAAVVGTAVAVDALETVGGIWSEVSDLRDRLEARLLAEIPGSAVHGVKAPRLPNTISLHCPHRNASDLVAMLSRLGVAASSGAACSTGGAPSHVIRAMGFSDDRANSTLRLSLSRFTTATDVDRAARKIIEGYYATLASKTWS